METRSTQTNPAVQVPADRTGQQELVTDSAARRPGRKANRTSEVDPKTVLTGDERLRSRILAGSLAKLAARQPEVIAIRKRLLGGQLLPSSTAHQLMARPSLGNFSPGWFRKHGIPIFEHHSSYLEPRTEQEKSSRQAAAHVVIEWGRQKKTIDLRKTGAAWRNLDAEIRDPDGVLPIRTRSVLWELLQVAKTLSIWYDWGEYDAVAFILDGSLPNMPAIRVQRDKLLSGLRNDHKHDLITLHIEPWVKPDSVKRAYRLIQRACTGKQLRTLDPKTLHAFAFAEERLLREFGSCSPGIKKLSEEEMKPLADFWTRVADDWNKMHGRKQGWHLSGRNLSRTFKRAHRALLWLRFRPFWLARKQSVANKPSTETDAGRAHLQRRGASPKDRQSRSEARGRGTRSKRIER